MRVLRPLFKIGVAVDLVILLCCLVYWLFDPGDRAYDFLFRRSPVQYLTLTAFALAVTLLGCRFIRHVRSMRELRRIRRAGDLSAMPRCPLGDQIRTLRDALDRFGTSAAVARAESLAQRQEEETQREYEVINFLLGSMPALGLFGTMLGLSDGLFKAFSKGFGQESIQGFIGSLGIALDTTVLALACALVAGFGTWVLTRTERLLHARRTDFVETIAGLDRAYRQTSVSRVGRRKEARDSHVSETVRREVSAVMAESMTAIGSRFDECLARLEEFARAGSERSGPQETEAARPLDLTTLTQAVTSCLDGAMERIAAQIAVQNGEAARATAAALDRFAEAMEASNVVDTVRAEVRAAMSENMAQVNATLQAHLGQLEEVVRTSVDCAARLESQSAAPFDQAGLVEAVASCLNEAMQQIRESMSEHSAREIQTIAAALRESSKATNARFLQALITCNGEDHMELTHV